MSDQEPNRGGRAEFDCPPEWIEQSKRDGTPITMWATSTGGVVYLAVWRTFNDASRLEHGLAETPLHGYDPIRLPSPVDAVARVRAVRQARSERLDLADGRWEWVVSFIWPTLSDEMRKDHAAILAAVQALAPSQEATPPEARGLTENMIRTAAQKVRKQTRRAPTRLNVALELATSESTLDRAMEDLGMDTWPPAPPKIDGI